MFLIAWSTSNQGINLWQIVDDKDAMQEFVHDLTESGLSSEDVFVFSLKDQI